MPSPLQTAAISTFESLALLFADPATGDARADAPLSDAVRVAFTGPFAGALTIAVTDDVAVALAANMLGLEPEVAAGDGALRRDALGEVANVVCGNVLPLVAGREAVFHLAAPAPVSLAEVAPPSGPGLAESLGVETGHAWLALQIDTAIPASLAPALAAAGIAATGSTPMPAAASVQLVP